MTQSAKKPAVAVLGAGSWGTALAALIARHGHPTVLWGRDAATIAAIEGEGENPRYLPGIPLPGGLRATTSLHEAMASAGLVLVVVPSHAFAETLRALAPLRPPPAGVAWATKGFEPGSGRFLHEVAGEVLGDDVPLAVVTGPSFAKEVALGLPTALTVHSDDPAFAQQTADVLHGPAFRAYTGDDMRGAELGGAMKNALDWVVGSGELYEKPVGIISAGTTGGPFARQVLARTLLWQGARLVAQLGISAPRTKSDASGEITDPATVAAIEALAHDIAAAMAASPADRDAASIRVAASLGVRRDDDTAHIAPSARFER